MEREREREALSLAMNVQLQTNENEFEILEIFPSMEGRSNSKGSAAGLRLR